MEHSHVHSNFFFDHDVQEQKDPITFESVILLSFSIIVFNTLVLIAILFF